MHILLWKLLFDRFHGLYICSDPVVHICFLCFIYPLHQRQLTWKWFSLLFIFSSKLSRLKLILFSILFPCSLVSILICITHPHTYISPFFIVHLPPPVITASYHVQINWEFFGIFHLVGVFLSVTCLGTLRQRFSYIPRDMSQVRKIWRKY